MTSTKWWCKVQGANWKVGSTRLVDILVCQPGVVLTIPFGCVGQGGQGERIVILGRRRARDKVSFDFL